ncbi:hypothetical protein GEMRC1_009572 [Eukaryota sp. GEM-RC1]
MIESTRFKGKSYYEVLGVDQSASAKEIRRAYLKLAVECHPDKNPDNPDATTEFQDLGKVFTCLKDPDSRAFYDQTKQDVDLGDWDNLSQDQKFEAVMQIFNASRFDEKDIDSFLQAETDVREESSSGLTQFEQEQVLEFYEKYKGKWSLIFQCVPGEGKRFRPSIKSLYLERSRHQKLLILEQLHWQ